MEGCGYRDLNAEFQALGVKIVGVGFDPPAETAPWVEEEGFQYEIWTDVDKTLASAYQAIASPTQAFPSRITVLLDGSGEWLLEYREDVQVGTHPAQVLEDCQRLFGP